MSHKYKPYTCILKNMCLLFPQKNILYSQFKNVVICIALKFRSTKSATLLNGKKKKMSIIMHTQKEDSKRMSEKDTYWFKSFLTENDLKKKIQQRRNQY